MTSLAERVAAAQVQAAQEEQDKKDKAAATDRELTIKACDSLREAFVRELDVSPRTLRESSPYFADYQSQSQSMYDVWYVMQQVDGFWFGVVTGHYTWSEYIHKWSHIQELVPLVVCSNRHIVKSIFRGNTWERPLAELGNAQAALSEGDCWRCVKEGKHRNLAQQLLDMQTTSILTFPLFIRAALTKKLFTEQQLRNILVITKELELLQ